MIKPIFLICSERSGSNLIRSIIGSHSKVWGPMPMHLLQTIFKNLPQYGDLKNEKNWELLVNHTCRVINEQIGDLEFEVTEEELLQNTKEHDFWELLTYIYNKGLAIKKKERLFFKENYIYQFIPALIDQFPDAQFIVQVRDPRDFVLSMINRTNNDLLQATSIWEKDQTATLELSNLLPDRVHIHSYEDLISKPETVLRSICDHVDINFEESMLNFSENTEVKKASNLVKSWGNLSKGLISTNQKKYLKELSSFEIKLIEYRLKKIMDKFEYEREFPDPEKQISAKLVNKLNLPPMTKIIKKMLSRSKNTEWFEHEKIKRKNFQALRSQMKVELEGIKSKKLYSYK